MKLFIQQKKNLSIILALFVSSLVISQLHSKPEHKPEEDMMPPEIDTVIPKNHSLIPIEIKNSESLDSIFGNYGLANLYVEANGRQRLVVKNIKLLRAPKNPSHFAVLVKDAKAHLITRHEALFFVTLSSDKNSGTVFVEETPRSTSNIQIGIEND